MNNLDSVKCRFCGKASKFIPEIMPVCLDCIRSQPDTVMPFIEECHEKTRLEYGLPGKPPKAEEGIECGRCVNQCIIPAGQRGYCGLKENKDGKLRHIAGVAPGGMVSWYYDSLPTNCVADWVCPGGSDCGYPDYSYSKGPELGYRNLAVFYEACSFNCLFCQNWQFKKRLYPKSTKSADELAGAVKNDTACICYFGGDPTPQLDHAIAASRIALENAKGRILRICWETNGSMSRNLLKKAAQLSLESGGCIKFDIKAYDDNLNRALCGASNEYTLDNFRWLASLSKQRPDPPLLVASTLLVPGYIDVEEVTKIADFIAALDPQIPYTLLGFYPSFMMYDLPATSVDHAKQALEAAKSAGLKRVKIGNRHLLSVDYRNYDGFSTLQTE
jgi:pyruvate formate lyase activating enzyme